jgi:murein DD-endopeptidase MepM/ murein hydrolase activator NlpD
MLAGVLAVNPSAQASKPSDPPDPKAQKQQLDNQVKASKADLEESYDTLQASVTAYDQASAQLAAVQQRYATVQGELAAAKAADVVAAQRLVAAEKALAAAKSEVVAGEQEILRNRQAAGQAVRSTYQQQNNLVSLSIVLRGASANELATGLQVRRNLFASQGTALARLNDSQAQLANRQVKVAAAEKAVAAQRVEAARTVVRVTELTEDVAEQKAEVVKLAQAKLRAYYATANLRSRELNAYYKLVNERNRVARILIARASAEKIAAAKRRAAAIAAERAKAARERRRPRPVPQDPGSDGDLIWPINTYITSPYGMRFHPILRYWKLHDGTDFGGGCGTPIRAAAGGIVTDRYYNGGYGNRVFISHGVVKGSALVTVYNHLSRYSTYVGQRVFKGDIIGYVGTTGYSTGCHLHFMVYQDGQVVNPMNWL